MDHLSGFQISEWEAFDRLDPIGSWREDFRMAFIAAILTNLTIAVHGKKGAKLSSPIEFMPKWDERKEKEPIMQSVEEMKQILFTLADSQKVTPQMKEFNSRSPHKHYEP